MSATFSLVALLPWLMAMALVWLLTRSGLRLWSALQTLGWREVEAELVSAEMKRLGRKGDEGCSLFDPVIRYTYSVNGNQYEGRSVSTESHSSVLQQIVGLVTRFQGGRIKTVKAFHHPKRPDLAVLVPLPWQGPACWMVLSAVGLTVVTQLLLP
jgi:hypothetical protein